MTLDGLFRLLGDSTRLRLLRVLMLDRFNVTELTGILGLAQSGVSRHLSLLKDAGLLAEEREGGFSYYSLRQTSDEDEHARIWPVLRAHFASHGEDPTTRQDEARRQEVLRLRKENFEAHGETRQLVPGRSWAAWSRALGHLLPPLDVADIGCGEGYLTLEAARWARSVVGVDRSEVVLQRAKQLARRRTGDQCPLEEGRPLTAATRRRVTRRRIAVADAPPRQQPGSGPPRGRSRRTPKRPCPCARPSGARPRLGPHATRRSAPRVYS